MDCKFNITLDELEKAVEFAKVNGHSEFKTITIEKFGDSGIGSNTLVSKISGDNQIDITNYGSW